MIKLQSSNFKKGGKMCRKIWIRGLVIGIFIGLFNVQAVTQKTKIENERLHVISSKIRLENARPLTGEGTWYMAPCWSPDGKKIAFTKAKYRGIYVGNADGSGKVEEITDAQGAGLNFVWSPDGKKIAFSLEGEIKVIDLSSKEIKSITQKKRYVKVSRPSLLSPGEFFYIVTDESGETKKYKLVVSDIEGRVKGEIVLDMWGSLSPDKKKIAFLEPQVVSKSIKGKLKKFESFDTVRIWIANADGSSKKLLTQGGYLGRIRWSPDSKKILVDAGLSQCVFEIKSGKCFDLGNGKQGCWSPDGNWILYVIMKDDGHRIIASDLYLTKWDGTQKVQITNTDNLIEEHPTFSPYGDKIAFSTEDGRIFVADLVNEK